MFKTILLGLVLLTTSATTQARYYYNGDGLTTNDSYQQMLDHVCLTFIVFLEARGDGRLSQKYHGMAIINRVMNVRWSNTVCDVILDKQQFEAIGHAERVVVNQMQEGNIFAGQEFVTRSYPQPTYRKVWREIADMTYDLITSKERGERWLLADHFYSPTSLSKRGMAKPNWIQQKETVKIAGDTHFLR